MNSKQAKQVLNMKTVMGAVAAAMVLSACAGGERIQDVNDEAQLPDVQVANTGGLPPFETAPGPQAAQDRPMQRRAWAAPELEAEAVPGTKLVEVRMRGINAHAFTALELVPNGVRAWADGKPISVQPSWHAVDLTRTDHAERVAVLALPLNAQEVRISVQLGAAGGYSDASARGWVDTRDTTLELVTSGAQLLNNGRAVLVIDASKSFVQRSPRSMVFVPKFRVY